MTAATKKARKQDAATPSLADLLDPSKFRPVPHYTWREVERGDEDPLRIRVQVLSMRQADAIPWTTETPMADIYEAIAPHVVDWDLHAENIDTGELVAVPSPAQLGPEVFELLPNSVGTTIALWLKFPSGMARAAQATEPNTADTTGSPETE